MSMWHELMGEWAYQAGSGSATVTIPKGSAIIQIIAHANPAGTLQIFGGQTIPLPANDPVALRFNHLLLVAGSVGSTNTIVFGANTTTYLVEYVAVGKGTYGF